jgi:hypothetical protein
MTTCRWVGGVIGDDDVVEGNPSGLPFCVGDESVSPGSRTPDMTAG